MSENNEKKNREPTLVRRRLVARAKPLSLSVFGATQTQHQHQDSNESSETDTESKKQSSTTSKKPDSM
jgi:hypothetical protein